ncbi:T9SS type A sorting domain-containing protein [Hanstruepera marina]|uniref:T9SS type A sorting domain-containing protein n=1 Tax=Hanstruepera marina TaxID=2873265 RepID=UPI001CA60D45|nr:T9SS type A sorting domain-containing protein [Hanstruepera marina]
MKKIYFLLFSLVFSSFSFGQVIIAEDFSYPDGSLVANSAWANTSGTANQMQVVSGQAVVNHNDSEDVEITFSSVSGSVYAGFDFSVDDLGAPYSGTDNEYFAHLDFAARIDIVEGTGGGDFSVGISTTTSTAEATWATDLTFGQTYRLIVEYDQDGGVAELWIDPTLETDTSISGSVDTTPATVTSFDLRQSSSSENETIRIDNLMVGQTFDDVVVFQVPTDPSLTIINPGDGTVFSPGTTNVDVTIDVQNFVVDDLPGNGGSGDGHIHWTLNGVAQPMKYDTDPVSIPVTDGQSYTVFMQLVDNSHAPIAPAVEATVNFSVSSITQVSDIAALRAGSQGEFYELTGEAFITYIVTENTRNQKYIQDNTGGILIDDPSGTITTSFNIGDGMTGLKGELSQFSGVLQFVPIENLASASSTGNTVTPEEISVATFLANGEDYESELIKINNVTFADTGMFTDNTNYDIADGGDVTVARVSFGDENLIGANIPAGVSSVIGLGGQFNATYQILPRYVTDVEGATLSVDTFTTTQFAVYPNPVTSGIVNITSTSNEAIGVKVYDILGKQVLATEVSNNILNVSSLKAGIYILNINQSGNVSTKKLIIK